MRVVGEYVEGCREGLLVDALRVVGGGRAPLLLLPAEAHGVHLQHRLDVDLDPKEDLISLITAESMVRHLITLTITAVTTCL